jgi:hypothetical protein
MWSANSTVCGKARQSPLALLYLEYCRVSRLPEYFERGAAGLSALFTLPYCPESSQVKMEYELKHPMFGS